jgi:hypothetical protein
MDRGRVFHYFLRWVFEKFFDNHLVKYLFKAITWFFTKHLVLVKVPNSLHVITMFFLSNA